MRYGTLRCGRVKTTRATSHAVMLWSFTLFALCATAYGRAVNISNTWVLPEEGFPVFYRYFRDRISWYEADAVCQFHHANLVTVDTTAQYDAVRAYLRELDISSAVWVGLIRSNPDGDFTWTDYRGLSGEGYWSSAPDNGDAPLCAAADPAADYRWEARACGGPSIASFICELPVPQWALGAEGCMVRALPALTALYLPESASIQLTTDCGLAGVKKVQCNGNVKREDLLKELSCFEYSDDDVIINSTTPWSLQTTSNDLEISKDTTTPGTITTEQIQTKTTNIETTVKPPELITAKISNLENNRNNIKPNNEYKPNSVVLNQDSNVIINNNLESNDVPKLLNEDELQAIERNNKLQDEQLIQHKILHEEIARRGNFETIFTQPTDHFVPPLVMAKAKLSDDLTVMSLEEKHAHLAEEKRLSHSKFDAIKTVKSITSTPSATTTEKFSTTIKVPTNKMPTTEDISILTTLIIPTDVPDKRLQNTKTIKNSFPKKYTPNTYDNKEKSEKSSRSQIVKETDKTEGTTQTSQITTTLQYREPTTVKIIKNANPINIIDNQDMELEVSINGVPQNMLEQTESIEIVKSSPASVNVNNTTVSQVTTENYMTPNNENFYVSKMPTTSFDKVTEFTPKPSISYENVTENDITIIPESYSPVKNVVISIITDTPIIATDNKLSISKEDIHYTQTSNISEIVENTFTTNQPIIHENQKVILNNSISTVEPSVTIAKSLSTTNEIITTNYISTHVTTNDFENSTSVDVITDAVTSEYNIDENSTDHSFVDEGYTSDIDDFQSPLLSGANEPLPKPNRSRRPQTPPNRNKFNPFRILG